MSRGPAWVLCVVALALATPAAAQPKPTAEAPLTEEQQKAQAHFQHAKELYSSGAYREAIAELLAARELDPKAKDLVYNLGTVSEKLGKFDDAIAYFRQYQEMDSVTNAERQKADAIIKRIEGAKREVAPAPTVTATAPPPPPPPPPAEEKRGRIDAATIAAASVTVVGLGVGTVFGIRAVSIRPNNFVTGRDGTYADLQQKTNDAHTSAIVADVGFGVGIVAALATAWLYFGRTTTSSTTGNGPTPSAALLPGGGAVLVGGSFR